MKTKLPLAVIFIAFAISCNLFSQQASEKPGLGRGSIESQFNYVIYQSEKLNDLRQVKAWWLHKLKKEVLDSLQAVHNELKKTQVNSSDKSYEISSLQGELLEIKAKLEKTEKEKNSIILLGIQIGKSAYNTAIWAVIFILTAFLAMLMLLFRRSNIVSVKTKKELAELKDEFEAHRKRSLEREQKVVRELYDEILKYKSKVKQ